MGGLFGLGILLTLQDRASSSVRYATGNLERLEQQTRETINAVTDLERANTGLSSSNPSMTLSEMASQMHTYTYYYDQFGRLRRRHNNSWQRELMRMTGSANDMAQSLQNTIRPWGQFAGMTSSGKQVARMMNGIARETLTARRALVGFNADGTQAITQDQTRETLNRYRTTVNDLQARLHTMYQNGEIDALSYQSAVQGLATDMRQIERINQRGFRTTSQYYSMLQQAGISTNAIENQRGIALERNRTAILGQARTLLETKTGAMKLQGVLEKTSPVIGSMTKDTLGLASAIQQASKNFDPMVVQAKLFNEGWSGKEINDYMMSMSALAEGLTTVFPILTVGVMGYYTALGALAYNQIPAVQKSFERFKKASSQALSPLTKAVGEIMIKVLELGTAFMKSVREFEKAHPIITKIVTAMALIVPALGLIVAGFVAVKTAGGFIWQSITANITQAGGSVMGLAEAIGLLTGIFVTVAGYVGIFLTLYENCETFRKGVNNLIKDVQNFVKEFKEAHPTITAFFDNIGLGMMLAFTGVTTFNTTMGLLSSTVGKGFGRIISHTGRVGSVIGTFASRFSALVSFIGQIFLHPIAHIQSLPIFVQYAFGGIRSTITGFGARVVGVFNLIKSKATWSLALVRNAWVHLPETLSRFKTACINYATHPLLLVKDTAKLVGRGIKASFTLAGASVKWFGRLCTHPISALKQLGVAVKGLFSKLPINPWIIAIGLVTAGIIALWKTNEKFRNAVIKIWGNIKEFVGGVITNVKEAMDGKLKPVIENVKSIFSSLGTIFGTVFSVISSVLSVFFGDMQSTGDAIDTVSSIITGVLTGALNVLNDILTPVAEGLKKFADYVKENKDAIEGGLTVALQVLGGILQAIVCPIVESVTEFWKEHGNVITNKVKLAYETLLPIVGNVIQGIFDVVSNILSELSAFWQEHGDQIVQIVSTAWGIISQIIIPVVMTIFGVVVDAFSGIVSFIAEHSATIQQVVSLAFQTIKLVIGTVCTFIGGVVQTVASIITGSMTFVSQLLTGDFAGAWNTLCDTVGNVCETIWTTVTDIFNQVTEYLSSIDLFEIGANVIQGLIDGILSLGGGVIDAVSTIGQSILDGFTSFLGIHSPSTVMYDQGVYTIQGLVNGMNAQTSIVSNSISNVANLFSNLKNQAEPFIQGFVSSATNKFNTLKQQGSSTLNSLKSTVSSAMSNIASTGSQKIQSFAKAIGNGVKTAKNNMTQTIDSAVNHIKKINLRSIGVNMIRGLSNGIKSMANNVINSVTGVVSGAVNKAKALLKIKSPSRVFQLIGRQTIQGYNVGVETEGKHVPVSVSKVVQSAIDTPKPILRGVSNVTNNNNNTQMVQGSSNDTYNFTIEIKNAKDFTQEDAERIFDMIQKVKRKRDILNYA